MQFSVLLSIYHKENHLFFHRAMTSIWDEQSLKPDEIVLVEDGPLTDSLYEAISYWQKKIPTILKTIKLDENQGLGKALAIGLEACSFDIVARMDTDDIALPHRFEKQIQYFNKNAIPAVNYLIDVCGSWVDEFDDDENNILSTRKLPEFHHAIATFSKKRNPVNHPSVMYKKDVIIKAGNYQPMDHFEDWFLWVRVLEHGATFYNIQESLVKMRAGFNQLERRSGPKYAEKEFYFFNTLRKRKYLNSFQYLLFFGRILIRLLPRRIIHLIYKLLRGKK